MAQLVVAISTKHRPQVHTLRDYLDILNASGGPKVIPLCTTEEAMQAARSGAMTCVMVGDLAKSPDDNKRDFAVALAASIITTNHDAFDAMTFIDGRDLGIMKSMLESIAETTLESCLTSEMDMLVIMEESLSLAESWMPDHKCPCLDEKRTHIKRARLELNAIPTPRPHQSMMN